MISADATCCTSQVLCPFPIFSILAIQGPCRLPKHLLSATRCLQSAYPKRKVCQASANEDGQDAVQQEDQQNAGQELLPRKPSITYRPPTPSVTQRKPGLEARMRIKAYRREALLQRRSAELEEEAKKIDLDPAKLLKKGDPSTVQAVIKDIIPVGYFLAMPNGKEGFLPSTDFGFSGGVVILQRLFKVGQVLTVRVVRVGSGGREILSMRKELPSEAC